jgi:hypothetical protein
MKRPWMLAWFFLASLAAGASEPVGVRQLAIDIVYVETVAEVESLYVQLIGPLTEGDLQGFAGAGTRPDGTPVCLVVALRPKADKWDDRRTTVLGHELRHCLGESHREPGR